MTGPTPMATLVAALAEATAARAAGRADLATATATMLHDTGAARAATEGADRALRVGINTTMLRDLGAARAADDAAARAHRAADRTHLASATATMLHDTGAARAATGQADRAHRVGINTATLHAHQAARGGWFHRFLTATGTMHLDAPTIEMAIAPPVIDVPAIDVPAIEAAAANEISMVETTEAAVIADAAPTAGDAQTANAAASSEDAADPGPEHLSLRAQIFTHLASHPDGARQREIVEALAADQNAASQVLRDLMESGKVTRRSGIYFAI